MPTYEPMQDMTPDRYGDTRWVGVHGVTDVVWPCPRCAATLTATAGRSMTIHACTRPTAGATSPAALARVSLWWAGYDAAQATTPPCGRQHVPDGGHCVVIDPTSGPAVILTTGGAYAPSYLLTDDMRSGDDVFGRDRPVLRAVLAARLSAMAALLATPAPEDRP